MSDLRTARMPGAMVLTMNRPEALNALTPAMIAGFTTALDEAEADPAVRSIVITGEGRAFCAGADLKAALSAMGEGTDPSRDAAAFLGSISALTDRLEQSRLPVIAALNGTTVAGGIELALACDLVIAVRSARIGDGHARYGLLPGGGGSVRLPRRIGVGRAKYLMFTAQLLEAEVLREWGLVNEVVDDDRLPAAIEQLVLRLADKSPVGLARMKQLLTDSLEQPPAAAMRAELTTAALHYHSHDRAEGLAAFAEHRPPRFTGA